LTAGRQGVVAVTSDWHFFTALFAQTQKFNLKFITLALVFDPLARPSDDTAEKTQWLGIIDAVSRSALAGIELTIRCTGKLSH
jgi:hypothetical protein